MIENKKILIVGKRSFISKHLYNHFCHFNRVKVVLHDDVINGKYDIVINVACPASPPVDSGISILEANSELMFKILCYCQIHKSMLIHLSSGEADFNRKAGHPHYCYSVGKRFSEALCYEFNKQDRVDTRIVRLYNTYGRGMNLTYSRCQSRFINDALHSDSINVHGSAKHIRTFTHINDTCEGIELVIEKGIAGETYELANPEPISIYDFAVIVGKISGKPVNKTGDDIEPDSIIPDISKIKALGWTAKVDLKNGLKETICNWRTM